MGAELAGLNADSIKYIFSLIEVNMRHSYFHEPDGIFRTTSGFSMGDVAASCGSDLVLRGAELLFYAELHSQGLLPLRYLHGSGMIFSFMSLVPTKKSNRFSKLFYRISSRSNFEHRIKFNTRKILKYSSV